MLAVKPVSAGVPNSDDGLSHAKGLGRSRIAVDNGFLDRVPEPHAKRGLVAMLRCEWARLAPRQLEKESKRRSDRRRFGRWRDADERCHVLC